MKQASGYCSACRRRVYATGRSPNHLLHLVLSVITFGLWLVVWLLLAVGTAGNYRCTRCGGRVSRSSGHAGRYGVRASDPDD